LLALDLGEHFIVGALHPVSLLAQDFIMHLHPMRIVDGFGNADHSRRSEDRGEHDKEKFDLFHFFLPFFLVLYAGGSSAAR
jgi:hypothetical protein